MATAEQIQAQMDALSGNMTKFDTIVNGDDQAEVATPNGNVPSVSNFYRQVDEANGSAAASASEALEYRNGAELLKVQTEAARDAAVLGADGVYSDTAAGIAGTSSGGYFTVVSPSQTGYLDLYLNSSGTAVYQDTYPNRSAVSSSVDGLMEVLQQSARFILDQSSSNFSRGNHQTAGTSVNASLKGWRAPFKHSGVSFNVVQLSLRAQADNTGVVVRVWDGSLNELARGRAVANIAASTITVFLSRTVDDLALDDVGYISYEPEGSGVLGYPAGNGADIYPAGDADPSVDREYYMNSSGAWAVASPAGNYCITFRTFDLADSVNLSQLTDILADIATLEGGVTNATLLASGQAISVYDLVGYTGHDTTYTSSGLGTQVPAQAGSYQFNRVTVWGGCNGVGKLRGYLVDSATSATHAPASAGTLLFDHDINWTNVVEARQEFLASPVTVPAGKELHILWASDAANSVIIGRWSTDPDTNLPRIRLSLTGAGDLSGIWSETWYDGSPAYYAVPPKLEMAPSAGAAAAASEVPNIVVPGTVYAAVGTELCLHHDALVTAHSNGLAGLSGYSCAVVGPVGANNERFFRFTPDAGNVGNHTMTAKLWDAAGNLIEVKTFTLTVVSATAKASPKNVLMVGDSLTAPGIMTSTAQGKFSALGGTVPVFLGTQGTAPANHEGYGGRKFQDFATAGTDVYRVTVSGVSAVTVGAVYSVGGVNYTVSEVNLSGGSGNLLLSGASSPGSSGTLTMVSGSGDATISFSASSTENTNPFWHGGAVDITAYRSANSIASPFDYVAIQLGINDVFSENGKSTAQIDAMVGYAQDLCDAFLADNASCTVVVSLPSLCGNTVDGFAANYGASYSREVYESSMKKLRNALLDAFDSGAYSANVKVGAAGLVVDRYYGYTLVSGAVSSRVTETTLRHTNAVHPASVGYQQMGDQHFAEMMALL